MRSTPFAVNITLSRNVQLFSRAELQDRVDDSAVIRVTCQNNLSHNEIVIAFVPVVCCDR